MVARTPFTVPGFKAAAAASGMRYRDREDVGLIVMEAAEGAAAGGVFTTNRFCAAPVTVCREHLAAAVPRAVIVNAGIANACTGEEGLQRARVTARAVAGFVRSAPESVLVASTGVIGQQIQVEPIERVLPELVDKLAADRWEAVARAIMTTDTVPKLAGTQVQLAGSTVTVGGVAKGSGMIAPNMATLLAFVATDAAVAPEVLDHWLRSGADASFNCITVDGDTSTNDTLLVLASGQAGNPLLKEIDSPDSRRFGNALQAVLLDLAKQIVMDGEGATKFIAIRVSGAPDVAGARTVAFTIAHSPLVKTAFFGEDANWGRIVAAAGRAGVPLTAERVTLFFDDLCVFRDGTPVSGAEVEEQASAIFRRQEIPLHLDLGMGTAEFTAYSCDLSYDYVKINASYRS